MNAQATSGDGTALAASLARMDLFRGVHIGPIEDLLVRCPVHTLAAAEVLIRAGEPNDSLYLVLEGRMRVLLHPNDTQPVAVIEAGESVGELSIIDQQPASANVVADCETRVLVISEQLLWSLVKSSHGVACNLLNVLAQRLRHGNAVIHRIQELLHEYEYEATIDPLTSLFNRRWLGRMLRRYMQRANQNGQPLAVAMIDIDHFKRYNDEYGHLTGDRALQLVSRCLVDHLRPDDTVTRYGGEELFAILPHSDLADARRVAERLRSAVQALEISLPGGSPLPPPTISIGVAVLTVELSPDELIATADAAMYRAKHAGRNRVSD